MEKQFLLFIGKTFLLISHHRIIATNKAINNTNSKDRPKKKSTTVIFFKVLQYWGLWSSLYSEGTLKQSEFGINDLRKFLLKAFLECYFDTRVLLTRDLIL